MNVILRRLLAIFALFSIVALLAYESMPHFNRGLIQLKRDNNSAQRNWNLFYGQRFVFYDGPFRYNRDLEQIRHIISPGHTLLSDLATSYYAAAYLPLYARNVHKHQGRKQSLLWQKMLDQGLACNLHQEGAFSQFKAFISADRALSEAANQPALKYVLVNKDENNKNVRLDCLWNRRALFIENIARLSELIYQGEYLDLYQINSASSASAPKGH
jgi:hypothetical protein